MSAVVSLERSDPISAFLQELHELGPVAWSAISFASRARDARLWEWDQAFQCALDGGGGWAAEVAAGAANQAGIGARAAAMAAGAAAALAARHHLDDAEFDLLYRPVAEIVAGPSSRAA